MGMKYKDPTTGQLKELSLKAADTLPIGTIVDYDGEDVPEGWEQVSGFDLMGYILYDNDSGSNGNITLNDDVENYDYVDIFFYNNDNFYSSRRFYKPTGKKLVLESVYVANNNIVFKNSYITITENNLTRKINVEASNVNMGSTANGANTYITRIIGYKEV